MIARELVDMPTKMSIDGALWYFIESVIDCATDIAVC